MTKQVTVTLVRGPKPTKVYKNSSEGAARVRARVLADLHSVEYETTEDGNFLVDASDFYTK